VDTNDRLWHLADLDLLAKLRDQPAGGRRT
jgi:hypothetical protein